jgi:adenylate cyclase
MSAMRSVAMENRAAFIRASETLERGVEGIDPRVERLAKSMIRLYSGSDLRYLNFYGPPRTIATISYHELVQPTRSASPESLTGLRRLLEAKAVFVGYSAQTSSSQDRIRDDYNTVYNGAGGLRISGVEVAATAFANLLDGNDVRRLPDTWYLGLVVFLGMTFGVVVYVLRPALAVFVVALLAGSYVLLALRQFAASAWLLPLMIPIVFQAPLALFGGIVLHYRDARRDREAIKRAFGYFLPNSVVDQLAAGIGPIGSSSQLVYGACLSTDVEHYTTISEEMGPKELALLMNDYFAELFKPVLQRDGVVSDVVGDAMLAIWASSATNVSVRRNACSAALDMSAAIERFNHAIAGRPELRTRIGLHSGELLLGNIGAAQHYEYRAVGDIVNTATRIEGLNKYLGTRVLASEATIVGLTEFVMRPVGSFVFAGKMKPLNIFELIGLQTQQSYSTAQLCERFDKALGAYVVGRFREAATMFAEVLHSFPEDGPSRFYLRRCEELAATPAAEPWLPTIRLETK